MAELRKSHSNYILRRKRQLTSKGGIYERDWMTVSEMDGFAPGTLPVYASGNFKMTINNEHGGKKKYSFANWIVNDSGSTDWTLSVITEEQLKIKSDLIKPNYTSILDFAYYGSAVELIHGTVNDMIMKYPGELYLTGKRLQYATNNGDFDYINNVVENPFNIDVFSEYVNPSTIENHYRYMALSWDKYEVVKCDDDGNVIERSDILAWTPGKRAGAPCNNGDIVFSGATLSLAINICTGETTTTSSRDVPDGKCEDPDCNTVTMPLGRNSVKYYPALQTLTRDVHEYNNPAYNERGEVVSDTEVKMPFGNASTNYNRDVVTLEKDTHVYGETQGTPYGAMLSEMVYLEPKASGDDCYNLKFDGVYVNGDIYLSANTEQHLHIRLKEKYIDEIFETFDDFEKVLLNRDTKPKYKAKFYTPRETEKGVITHLRAYVWPTLSGGWNIDFLTPTYEGYINALLYIANYYDECRSDNIWRSYTHESIKNFDWTTPRDTYVPEMDGALIDTERLESILRVGGRQFDDLKRWIENIKFTVNVSYDSKNNMPDSMMSKFLEMSGWEVKNVSPMNDNSVVVTEEYPGIYVKNNAEDANNEFLKRMILNSRNILSKKGTRAGIEAMYSMFGLFEKRYGEEYYYTIDEYETFANKYISGTDADTILEMNSEKNGYAQQYERNMNDLCGLMATTVYIDDDRYIVPWHNLFDDYDGYAYYQMKGGWGKRARKNVITEVAPNVAELYSDSNFTIYDETVKNIKVVESFKELNRTPIGYFNEGDIYYVLSMTEAYQLFDCEEGNYSHYVIFEPANYTGFTGDCVPYNDDYNWCLIKASEFTGTTESFKTAPWYAKKIVYMESIHDSSIGNNPHNGNGNYDGGKEYFEYYNELFKGAIENSLFSEYQDRIRETNSKIHYDNRFRTDKRADLPDKSGSISGYSFDVDTGLTIDNSKIWAFFSSDSGLYDKEYVDGETITWSSNGTEVLKVRPFADTGNTVYSGVTDELFKLEKDERECYHKPIISSGETSEGEKIAIPGAELNIPSGIKALADYNSEEVLGYSVINTKNIKITYHLPWELEDYVTNIVEFYVKQLIPSTAIVEFVWDYTDGDRPAAKAPYSVINLSPFYQRIKAGDSEAEIDITSRGVDKDTFTLVES